MLKDDKSHLKREDTDLDDEPAERIKEILPKRGNQPWTDRREPHNEEPWSFSQSYSSSTSIVRRADGSMEKRTTVKTGDGRVQTTVEKTDPEGNAIQEGEVTSPSERDQMLNKSLFDKFFG